MLRRILREEREVCAAVARVEVYRVDGALVVARVRERDFLLLGCRHRRWLDAACKVLIATLVGFGLDEGIGQLDVLLAHASVDGCRA